MTIDYFSTFDNRLPDDAFDRVRERLVLSESFIRRDPAFRDIQNVDVFLGATDRPVDWRASGRHTVIIKIDPRQNPGNDELVNAFTQGLRYLQQERERFGQDSSALVCFPDFDSGLLSNDDFEWIRRRLDLSDSNIRRKAPNFHDLQNVDVFIGVGRCSPDLPVHGLFRGRHTVGIIVDPRQAEYYSGLENDDLSKALAHELHHIKRRRVISGRELTLAEALTSEGLAQCFELETGHSESPYSNNLTDSELLDVSERAREFILSGQKNYNHAYWFFGTAGVPGATGHFKKWSGYSLSFAVTSIWLADRFFNKEHNTAAKAVWVPADEVVRPWLDKGNEVLVPWLTRRREASQDRPAYTPRERVSARHSPG